MTLGPIKIVLNDDEEEQTNIDTPLVDAQSAEPLGSTDYRAQAMDDVFKNLETESRPDLQEAPEPEPVPVEGERTFKNKLDDLFEYKQEQNNKIITQNLALASMNDADQEAEIKRLSKESGMPAEMIRDNMEHAVRMVELHKLDTDKLSAQSPILARQLQDPEFANLAYDDIEHLGKYEGAAKAIVDTGRVLTSGLFIDILGVHAPDLAGSTIGSVNEAYRYVTGQDAGVLKAAADYLHGVADSNKVIADWVQGDLDGYSPEAQSAYSGIRSMGAMAPGMYAFLVTGNPSFILGTAGVNAAGSAVGEAHEQGMLESDALVYGITDGGIEVLTEMVPAAKLFKDLKTGSSLFKTLMNQFMVEVPQEQLATVLQDLNAWNALPSNAEKTFGDYLKERPPAAYHTLIATLAGTGAQTSLTYGGQKMLERMDKNAIDPELLRFAEEAQQAQEAYTLADRVSELTQMLNESKLNGRSKETMDGFIRELFQSQNQNDETMPEVLIFAQDLIQYASSQGIRVTDISPMIAPQLDEAITTGGYISFPIDKYLTEMANSEHGAKLLEMIRLDARSMSVSEANQWNEEANQKLLDQVDSIVGEAPNKESGDKIYDNIVEGLVNSGVPREEANKNAELYRAFFTVMGERSGVEPLELFSRYNLEIQRDMPENIQEVAKSDNRGQLIDLIMDPEVNVDEMNINLTQKQLQEIRDFIEADLGMDLTQIEREDIVNAISSPTYSQSAVTPENPIGINLEIAPNPDNTELTEAFNQLTHEQKREATYQVAEIIIPQVMSELGIDNYTINDTTGGFLDETNPSLIVEAPGLSIEDLNEVGKVLGYVASQQAIITYDESIQEGDGLVNFVKVVPNRELDFNEQEALYMHLHQNVEGVNGYTWRDGAVVIGDFDFVGKDFYDRIEQSLENYDVDFSFKIGQREFRSDYIETTLEGTKYGESNKIHTGSRRDVSGRFGSGDATRLEAIQEQASEELSSITGLRQENDDQSGDRRSTPASGLDGRVTLTHWSQEAGVGQLDPSYHGAGIRGAESQRKLSDPDNWTDRTYYAVSLEEGGGYQKEKGLGPHRYTASVHINELYDLNSDPDGYKAKAQEIAAAQPNYVNWLNLAETYISENYKGYWVNHSSMGLTAAVFKPLETESYSEETIENLEVLNNPLSVLKQDKRGSIQFRSSKAIISLFEGADRSTFLHESGHFFLQVMQDLGEDQNAPENIREEWQNILNFLEVESGDQIDVKQHEKWAQSFEKYLFEGKAPSVGLQAAFRRFKAWLTSVYKQLRGLGVEIDDDVRSIFDRMLATDQEIREAERASHFMPAFKSAEQAGMNEQEWKEYQESANRATREAEDDLDRKKLSELDRERKRWWKEEREKVREEVEHEVNQMPIYQVIHFLQTGEALDGELIEGVKPMRLDTKALTDEFGQILGQLPRGKRAIHTKEDGVHHDLIASLFGFESGVDMVQEMLKAKKRKDKIEELTTERMMQAYGNMSNDPVKLKEEAIKSAHMIDQRGRFLETELKALSKRASLPGTPANAAREAAREIIGRKKVSQLNVGRLRAAELNAARAAEKAILAEDWSEAVKQKRNQLLNHYLYREAEKAQAKVDRILRHLGKFQKPGVRKNLARDYLDQIDTILEKIDLKRSVSLKAIQNRQSFASWVKVQEANGDQVLISNEMEKILEAAEKVHYKEMTFEQLLDTDDLIKNIEHLARFKQKLIDGKNQREYKEVVAELVNVARSEHGEWKEDAPDFTNNNTKKFLDFGARFLGEHEKVEFLARFMDGEKDNGAFWRAIFKPIADAENAEMEMQERFSAKLNEIFTSQYTDKERASWNKVLIINKAKLTKRNILSMALNWGNLENRAALVEGFQAKFGITGDEISQILDENMDKRDWEAVQGVLDMINELWPQISQMQNELTGVIPKKVEAAPIKTKFGTFAGGYYPLKYDPKFSHRQELRSEKEGTQDLLESNWLRPATRKGHTIERVGSGGQMVRLDLGVLSEHVTNVIHDLTHRRAVIQIDRLTQDDNVRAAIEGVAGKEAYRQIRPWLQGVANDHVPLTSNLEKALAWSRHGASIVAMGFKMTTALVQPLGYSQSVVLLGEKWAGKGLTGFYRNPIENRDAILKKSVFMRHRMETLDRDVKDSLRRISGEESKLKSMHSKYFMFIGWMDMTVSLPTWQGGYEKALSEGMNEEDAIAHADSMVRQSQAGGGAKDLAQIQRGHEGKKLFTLFYSYFSALYNMQKRTLRMHKEGRISTFEAFRHFVWLVAMPAVLSELLLGRNPDEDDDESMAAWAAKTTLTYPFYSIVLVRDLVNYMANPQFGFSLPSADVAEGIVKGFTSIDDIWDDDEEFNEVDVKNIILGASFALQLPGRQAANMYEHLHEVMEGEDFSLWEFLVKRDRND